MQQAAAVREFLSEGSLGPWIDGRFVVHGGDWIECVDPGTGEPFARFHPGDGEIVNQGVETAAKAFRKRPWARASPAERARVLRRLAELAGTHRKTLAEIECLDTGRTLAQALADIAHFAQTLAYYADLAERSPQRIPIESEAAKAYTFDAPAGVCGVIIPWNFPIVLLGWNIAPALAAGNAVVVKPAEEASLSSLYIARLAAEAGLPAGVLNIVPGEGETTGAALAAHPCLARMSFTGSTEVGRSVAAACGRNLVPTKLELGGKGAAVVLDTDGPATVKALVRALTMNAGQVCCTATRWIIHRSLFDAFVEQARERLRAVRIGYWSDLKTRMGPLISQRQRDRVLSLISQSLDDGATALLWDGLLEGQPGFFVRPALLTGPAENIAANEEIFGPVAYLLPFDSEDEAVDLVHRSDYGLANSVWSSDADKATALGERLECGTVWINTQNFLMPGIPYLGIRNSGNGGGSLGANVLSEYMRRTSITRL
ncbi:MAG: aldehyde dehydrogenase family protein [Bryobacterales bacterium]